MGSEMDKKTTLNICILVKILFVKTNGYHVCDDYLEMMMTTERWTMNDMFSCMWYLPILKLMPSAQTSDIEDCSTNVIMGFLLSSTFQLAITEWIDRWMVGWMDCDFIGFFYLWLIVHNECLCVCVLCIS